tara:strand:- start:2151 stop:2408 length:258 start_codon:yes stop_codon:yes gene_type:complete
MKCCLCDGEVDKHYTPEGEMYWDKGHNPAPVKTGEDDRCCDTCNATVVIPARLVHAGGMEPEAASKLAEVIMADYRPEPQEGEGE